MVWESSLVMQQMIGGSNCTGGCYLKLALKVHDKVGDWGSTLPLIPYPLVSFPYEPLRNIRFGDRFKNEKMNTCNEREVFFVDFIAYV